MKPYNLTYPIAFDIEDTNDSGTRYDKMDPLENSDIAYEFLSTIEGSGHYPISYTYKSFAENYLDISLFASLGYDLWIAHYADECGYAGEHTIWQYKGDVTGFVGACPGVTGPCDLNVSYKDYAADAATPVAEDGADKLAALRDENIILRMEVERLNATMDEIARLLERFGIARA